MSIPSHQVRARFDATTLVVYQAFNDAIADAAVAAQRLVPPFSYGRMTWVKPSFLWMMERCGYATKPNQQRVLALHLLRARFDEACAAAVSTRVSSPAPIRVQWDPERDLRGGKLPYRSLQLGLGREVARAYATQWIVAIDDVTPLVKKLAALRRAGDFEAAQALLPVERSYPGLS